MRIRTFVSAAVGIMFLTGGVHAEGDPAKGKRAFAQCVACHSIDEGKHRVGPSLHAIMGKPAGAAEGFDYSPAMRDSGLTWDDATMAEFLAKPRDKIAGTKMAFAGIRDDKRMADIIAYLHTLSAD